MVRLRLVRLVIALRFKSFSILRGGALSTKLPVGGQQPNRNTGNAPSALYLPFFFTGICLADRSSSAINEVAHLPSISAQRTKLLGKVQVRWELFSRRQTYFARYPAPSITFNANVDVFLWICQRNIRCVVLHNSGRWFFRSHDGI